jgi:hypothetical protein
MSRLRPIAPARFRKRPVTESVELLRERISGLTLEREELRSRGASPAALERNRVQICRAQWQLSYALIERYLPAAAPSPAAQHAA